jgi:hypothetical protein
MDLTWRFYARSSSKGKTGDFAKIPVFKAFIDEMLLPFTVLGPVCPLFTVMIIPSARYRKKYPNAALLNTVTV